MFRWIILISAGCHNVRTAITALCTHYLYGPVIQVVLEQSVVGGVQDVEALLVGGHTFNLEEVVVDAVSELNTLLETRADPLG